MNITIHDFHEVLRDPKKRGKVLCLDVRTTAEHIAERIPDVYNIPLRELPKHIEEIKQYDEVYVHCQSGRRSEEAQKLLKSYGIKAVNVKGGANDWKSAGKAFMGEGKRMPIIQQVHAIAGGLVLISSLAGYFVSPWFLVMTGGVGAGLMFSGITGHCMMAYLLARMPWNAVKKATQLPWES